MAAANGVFFMDGAGVPLRSGFWRQGQHEWTRRRPWAGWAGGFAGLRRNAPRARTSGPASAVSGLWTPLAVDQSNCFRGRGCIKFGISREHVEPDLRLPTRLPCARWRSPGAPGGCRHFWALPGEAGPGAHLVCVWRLVGCPSSGSRASALRTGRRETASGDTPALGVQTGV